MVETSSLIKRILTGDRESFRIIVEEYQRLVSHIVFRMVYNQADREDLCQDIFLKVYKNLSQFQFGSKLSSWIAKIAYNACLDFLKKYKSKLRKVVSLEAVAEIDLSGEYSSPGDFTYKGEIRPYLQKEIARLSPNYRSVLTLYHLEEMGYADISKIMQIPEGTVKSHLFRARKLLKERLMSKYQKENQ